MFLAGLVCHMHYVVVKRLESLPAATMAGEAFMLTKAKLNGSSGGGLPSVV